MEWTQGPWESRETHETYEVVDSVGCVLVRTSRALDPDGMTDNERIARLIAAAPELYEALQIARVYVERDAKNLMPADIDFINAAIAKAEGR